MIDIYSKAEFNGTLFSNNRAADEGGALRITVSSIVHFTDVIFEKNYADHEGGCILADESTELYFDNATFRYNTARYGPGIHLKFNSFASIKNSNFFANKPFTSPANANKIAVKTPTKQVSPRFTIVILVKNKDIMPTSNPINNPRTTPPNT